MKIYMYVTSDKYELPLCVSPKVADIAKFAGVKNRTIYKNLSLYRHGKIKKTCYQCVEISEGDGEE